MVAITERAVQQASGSAWMYDKMSRTTKRWNDRLNVASGILGGVVGTAGLVSIFLDARGPLWARVVQVIVGFLIGVIAVLAATWRLSELQVDIALAQVDYAAIAHELSCQMAKAKAERPDASDYVLAKLNELEQLKISSPVISSGARKSYNREFQGNLVFMPEGHHYLVRRSAEGQARGGGAGGFELGGPEPDVFGLGGFGPGGGPGSSSLGLYGSAPGWPLLGPGPLGPGPPLPPGWPSLGRGPGSASTLRVPTARRVASLADLPSAPPPPASRLGGVRSVSEYWGPLGVGAPAKIAPSFENSADSEDDGGPPAGSALPNDTLPAGATSVLPTVAVIEELIDAYRHAHC